ncbi:hypothetical protein Q9R08_14975 [Microbacterium sp. QXD-8]|uniref:Uncharacterized protein n=1 Tax=Microbacterium psychrotolerans TaxID=3068321 RepID=A0ABU0Z3Y2_9MICO|nr:hypothetical protein [Microbacterium sp. QXD-8]MDQ7879291.1 hypothetical protein [Microbacterium sp. QXD-8]
MFTSDAIVSATLGPVAPDWTIQELVAWIADDDARSHDETLRPLLSAVLAGLAPDASPALTPRSPVALVRAVASHLRAAPALRDVTLGDRALRDVADDAISAAATQIAAATDRHAPAPAPASVRRPSLRLT